jgi:DNA-binding transcriptional MerR regulator
MFCVIDGPTRGRPWSSAAVRSELRRLAAKAGVRRRFAPHQLRHAHAVELAREGVPLNIIQRQLGHVNLGTTSIYLQGIDIEEIILTVNISVLDLAQETRSLVHRLALPYRRMALERLYDHLVERQPDERLVGGYVQTLIKAGVAQIDEYAESQ